MINMIDVLGIIKIRIFKKKLRTFLGILGIAVGVMSITAITTVGTSGEKAVFNEVGKMGLEGVNIKKQMTKTHESKDLKYTDTYKIKEKIKDVNVSGVYYNYCQIKDKDGKADEKEGRVLCIDSDFYNIANIDIKSGRFISNTDNAYKNNVCVIDDYTKEKIFGKENALGKPINITTQEGNTQLTVCGVMENNSGVLSDSMPLLIYIPISCSEDIFKTNTIDYICMYGKNEETTIKKAEQALSFLEKDKEVKDVFYLDNANEQKKTILNITELVKKILSGIGLISIIVGGIGIMNIMLVNVNERTREIGIKKSIGARNIDILAEFITEATILTTIAGTIGIIFGLLVSLLFSYIIDIPFYFTIKEVGFVFLISALSGIIFGGYPSLIAANLDPIKALE